MKKLSNILLFSLTLLTLFGFAYSAIATLKDVNVETRGKIIVVLVCLVGLLASVIAISHMIKLVFQKEEEIDEVEKDRRREQAYVEWLNALSEAEENPPHRPS